MRRTMYRSIDDEAIAARRLGGRSPAGLPSPGEGVRGTEGSVARLVDMPYDEVTAMKVTSGEPPFQRSGAAVTRRENSVG